MKRIESNNKQKSKVAALWHSLTQENTTQHNSAVPREEGVAEVSVKRAGEAEMLQEDEKKETIPDRSLEGNELQSICELLKTLRCSVSSNINKNRLQTTDEWSQSHPASPHGKKHFMVSSVRQ